MSPGQSMSNPTPSGASHNRRPSRSNSTSSSMVTVRKTTSLSSRSGSRGPFSKGRPASPEQVGFQLTAILTSNSTGSNNGSRSRPGSVADTKGQNINRWSHSTTSSISGLEEASKRRKSNASRRLSIGPIHTSAFIANSSKSRTSPAQESGPRVRGMSQTLPLSQVPQAPPPKLPPVTTLPNLSQSRSRSRTPSTTTPGTAELFSSTSQSSAQVSDYFGADWHSRGPVLPGIGVGAAEPMSGFNSAASPSRRLHEAQTVVSPERTQNAPRTQRAESRERSQRTGHSRSAPRRERVTNESVDTTAGSSISSVRSERSRNRGHRSPTQKTMLARALAKANAAVLLDNAQNFLAAIDAYTEACELLRQVMVRSSDEEDRNKLSMIRNTYSSRIIELKEPEEILPQINTQKALPKTPESPAYQQSSSLSYYDEDVPPAISEPPNDSPETNFPPRRQSLMPSLFMNSSQSSLERPSPDEEAADTRLDDRDSNQNARLTLQPPRSRYAPPPLSPRRPPSPPQDEVSREQPPGPLPEPPLSPGHVREVSTESTSWLDTIDESASSASSSRLSSLEIQPNFGSNLIDEIEAEFEAALSAAIDTAYHEGSRPGTTDPSSREGQSATPVTVRRSSITADSPILPAQAAQIIPHLTATQLQSAGPSNAITKEVPQESEFFDEDADEEERLLEEMTQGYGFGDFHFDQQSKSALPRQSDSSGFSGRTWPSSNGSTTATNTTSLSTLAEIMEQSTIDQTNLPSMPPPTGALPPVPISEPPQPPPIPPAPASVAAAHPVVGSVSRSMSTSTDPRRPSFDKPTGPGVRDRRLSGQNAKQLKIETHTRSRKSSVTQAPGRVQPASLPDVEPPPATEPLPKTSSSERDIQALLGPPSLSTLITHPLTPIASLHSASSLQSESPATPALTHGESQISVDETGHVPSSPGRVMDSGKVRPTPSTIRKNVSQSSLRMRNLSVATIENNESPSTPGSANFPAELRKAGNHAVTQSGPPIGGMYLFDDHIGTPNTPRTPRTPHVKVNVPATLEACPDSYLLRPFWLMRCLYQTIAHPRGGYVTNTLFIPRDIWRVKNVKLKAVEDKIAQCDLLSAALLRLANVDQFDADAVLEEMQACEGILESVRAILQKKLGSDVGLAGSSSMFKGVPMSPEEANEMQLPKAGSGGKFASGWRKLRSKSSAAQLNNFAALPNKDFRGPDAGFTISTVPMTGSVGVHSSRTPQPKRNPATIDLSNLGANANYMASLARLFDSAQILDNIARQVEDPGLKCSSKTHVGLELCVRNASEFFAFFVVRWVVADVGMLLDKFVKRGGEWVMS